MSNTHHNKVEGVKATPAVWSPLTDSMYISLAITLDPSMNPLAVTPPVNTERIALRTQPQLSWDNCRQLCLHQIHQEALQTFLGPHTSHVIPSNQELPPPSSLYSERFSSLLNQTTVSNGTSTLTTTCPYTQSAWDGYHKPKKPVQRATSNLVKQPCQPLRDYSLA